jgi:GTP diphosphokinase / guanosine-3',5'-bis(diphosphate) 3'-diphosphatase
VTTIEKYELLIKKIQYYHPTKDYSVIEKAYHVANEGHQHQVRKSGEPYIIHPLSVAYILAELELDIESIVAGILHDVIEDTSYGYKELVNIFGEEIADIVQGVTKLDNIEDDLEKDSQAIGILKLDDKNNKKRINVELQVENYRRMFIAMSKDIRVILIKIADRLHNMRTLEFMTEKKQKIKAQETLDIYAPLAHRLGISKLRYELEDLSFKYLYPEEYNDLSKQLDFKQEKRKSTIDIIIEDLEKKLENYNINFSIDGRVKHMFSIFKKMKNQNKTLEEIFDIFAVRIIVDKKMDCYEVLGVVHDMYNPVPNRFKDYIGMPKPNRYQSIHTVVMGPKGEPVEIQIRTLDMHRTAEYGIAAHWKYKEGSKGVEAEKEEEKLSWLRQMLDWQRDLSDKDFLEALKKDLDIFTDNVYCFTPKGEIISLVKGSTPIDFAYYTHSALGNRMVGAKVNGSIVPLNYEIKSGDRINIMDSQNSKGPSYDWINIAKTNQAKSKIAQWFKKQNKDINVAKGKEILEKEIKRKGYEVSDILTEKRKELVFQKYSCPDWDSLCSAIGYGGIKENVVLNKMYENYNKELDKIAPKEVKIEINQTKNKNNIIKSGIKVNGLDDLSVKFSKCCNPLPGDEIIGFVTRGRGISVHRTDCENILIMDEANSQRLVEANWDNKEAEPQKLTYNAHIKIIGESMTILSEIGVLLKNERMPITSVNSKVVNGVTALDIAIDVKDKKELEKIIKKISLTEGAISVNRIK